VFIEKLSETESTESATSNNCPDPNRNAKVVRRDLNVVGINRFVVRYIGSLYLTLPFQSLIVAELVLVVFPARQISLFDFGYVRKRGLTVWAPRAEYFLTS
jgi:hypothetical protein